MLPRQRYGFPSLKTTVKRHRSGENHLSDSEGYGGEAQHVQQELQHVKRFKIRLFDKIAVRPTCLCPRGTALPAPPPRHGLGVKSPTNTNSTKRLNRSYHELADKPASSHAKLVIRYEQAATSQAREGISMSGRITYRDTKPFCVPASLDELAGPSTGIVHLPVRLSWAPGDGSFSLDDDGERTTVYQCVIGEGSVEDQRRYLNCDILSNMWPTLRLDLAITAAWENRFKALCGRNRWLTLYKRHSAS